VSGEVYNIPGGTSMTNRALAEIICEKMNKNPNEYISYIKDRPGHDVRYAIDSTKMNSLGFRPVIVFEEGLKSTIDWYISKFESMEITALT
jgi:dTDP-glucose 4,6-dehydratase